MPWEIETTDVFLSWYDGLTLTETEAVNEAVENLAEGGPALGRPLVETIKHSRLSNLKELRVPVRNLRVLFVFDPRRVAVLLLGGDKTGLWRRWYDLMIPRAEQLYDEYLAELRREGLLE